MAVRDRDRPERTGQRPYWKRLSFKQTLAAVLAGLLLGLFFAVLLIAHDFRSVRQETSERYERVLRIVRDTTSRAVSGHDRDLARNIVDGLFQHEAVARAEIRDNRGEILARRAEPMQEGPLEAVSVWAFGDIGAYKESLGSAETGTTLGVISFALDPYAIADAFLDRAALVLLFGILLNLALAIILSILFHLMLTRPLAALVAGVQAEQSAVEVPPGHADDDLGDLVRAYNRLSGAQSSVVSELLESQARLHDFAEAASDWFWELDEDLRFTYGSKDFLGLDRAGVAAGLGIGEVAARAGGSVDHQWASLIAQLESRQPIREFELAVSGEDGRSRDLSLSAKPVFDAEGTFKGYRGTSSDITERKVAERAVAESEARLRAALEGAAVGFVVLDEAGVVELINPAAEQIFGYRQEEILGQSVTRLLPEKPPEVEEVGAGQLLTLDEIKALVGTRESVGLRKTGGVVPIQLGVGRIRIGGKPKLVASMADLSELKRLEADLVQAQKLEAVGQLTGGVAHDINNILGVISLNLEMATERKSMEEAAKLISVALKSADRGANLTHRLLAFARQQPLIPRVVDPGKLIRGMEDLLRRTLGENIEIEFVNDAGLWSCVVDPNQLENVVLNLAVNARDAMPDGGKLTIEASNARLDDDYAAAQAEVTPGQYVCIAVTDTGTGMPPEVIVRAFDPFYTTKGMRRGTGLGLSMAHGFIKQSGGHIKIYSELGEGTTIKVYLPRSRLKDTSAEEATQGHVEVRGYGERILVVEDDPDLLMILANQLRSAGFDVVEAKDATDALARIGETTDLRLLLTDVVLPGPVSGRELASRARELKPDLPIIFMSGYTENSIIHNGRLDEGVVLLQKPFRRTEMARTLRRVLDGT